jgi:hypothetical protein
MINRVALVRTDVSEERIASIIRVTRIDELGTTLAVTSNRNTLWKNTMASRVPFHVLVAVSGRIANILVNTVNRRAVRKCGDTEVRSGGKRNNSREIWERGWSAGPPSHGLGTVPWTLFVFMQFVNLNKPLHRMNSCWWTRLWFICECCSSIFTFLFSKPCCRSASRPVHKMKSRCGPRFQHVSSLSCSPWVLVRKGTIPTDPPPLVGHF